MIQNNQEGGASYLWDGDSGLLVCWTRLLFKDSHYPMGFSVIQLVQILQQKFAESVRWYLKMNGAVPILGLPKRKPLAKIPRPFLYVLNVCVQVSKTNMIVFLGFLSGPLVTVLPSFLPAFLSVLPPLTTIQSSLQFIAQ